MVVRIGRISWRFAVPLTVVAFGFGLPVSLGAGCAESVTSPDDDLFAGPPDDAGTGPDTATHHDYDAGHAVNEAGPAPATDASPASDGATAIDAGGAIDSAVLDAGVSIDAGGGATGDCPASSGKYTIEYLAATALAGEGGAPLPSCPCGSGMCCYTPPGGLGAPVCLAQ